LSFIEKSTTSKKIRWAIVIDHFGIEDIASVVGVYADLRDPASLFNRAARFFLFHSTAIMFSIKRKSSRDIVL